MPRDERAQNVARRARPAGLCRRMAHHPGSRRREAGDGGAQCWQDRDPRARRPFPRDGIRDAQPSGGIRCALRRRRAASSPEKLHRRHHRRGIGRVGLRAVRPAPRRGGVDRGRRGARPARDRSRRRRRRAAHGREEGHGRLGRFLRIPAGRQLHTLQQHRRQGGQGRARPRRSQRPGFQAGRPLFDQGARGVDRRHPRSRVRPAQLGLTRPEGAYRGSHRMVRRREQR